MSGPGEPVRPVLFCSTDLETAEDAGHVRAVLSACPGVRDAKANPFTGEVTAVCDASVEDATIEAVLRRAGFETRPETAADPHLKRAMIFALIPVAYLGARPVLDLPGSVDALVSFALALPALVAGRRLFFRPWEGLRTRYLRSDTFPALGILLLYASALLAALGVPVDSHAAAGAVAAPLLLARRTVTARSRPRDSRAAQQNEPLGLEETARSLTLIFGVGFVLIGAVLIGMAWSMPEAVAWLGRGRAWNVLSELGWPATPLDGALLAAAGLLFFLCPFAPGLAGPLTALRAMAAVAGLGAVLPGPAALDRIRNIRILCFPKTGTVTEGRPVVKEFEVCAGFDRAAVLGAAAALERHSRHPIGVAIRRLAAKERVAIEEAETIVEIGGEGVRGNAGGKEVLLGKVNLLDAFAVDVGPLDQDVYRMAREGKTAVAVAIGGKAAGAFGFVDPLRRDIVRITKALKKLGIVPVLISGDAKPTAKIVGEQAGMDRAVADVRPDSIAEVLMDLKKETIHRVGAAGPLPEDKALLEASDVPLVLEEETAEEPALPHAVRLGPNAPVLPAIFQGVRKGHQRFVVLLSLAGLFNVLALAVAVTGLVPPVAAALAGLGAWFFAHHYAARPLTE